MAGRRIRSVKPEILDDEVVAALPHLEFRLFVSLIVLADDYGNMRGTAAHIKGAALWGARDSVPQVQAALDHMAAPGVDLIRLYEVRGQSYIHIRGWAKHQKVKNPGRPGVPGPGDDVLDNEDTGGSGVFSVEPTETVPGPSADPPETRSTDLDLDLDLDHRSGSEKPAEPPRALALALISPEPPAPPKPDLVAVLWAEQERLRAAARPGLRGLALTASARKAISGLLANGFTVDDLRACVEAYGAEAKGTGSTQYLDGVTNWRPDNVTRTLGRIGAGSRPREGPSGSPRGPHQPEPTKPRRILS